MEVVVADAVSTVMAQREILRCLRRISTSRLPMLGLIRRQWHQRRRMLMMRMAFHPTRTRLWIRRRKNSKLITLRNRFLILYHPQRRLLHHHREVMAEGEVVAAEIEGKRRGSAMLLHLVSLGVWG